MQDDPAAGKLLVEPNCAPGPPGISPKTLSSRLRRFELTGLVTRTTYPETPRRVVYQLSPAGERLEVVLAAMGAWVEQDLPRGG